MLAGLVAIWEDASAIGVKVWCRARALCSSRGMQMDGEVYTLNCYKT